jgi:Flp pilus assembly protein TadB
MLLGLASATAFVFLVVSVAVRQRRRTATHEEPFPHVVGAASAAATIGYVLGDALSGYGTRLGYALLALAVLGVFVAYGVDTTPVNAA